MSPLTLDLDLTQATAILLAMDFGLAEAAIRKGVSRHTVFDTLREKLESGSRPSCFTAEELIAIVSSLNAFQRDRHSRNFTQVVEDIRATIAVAWELHQADVTSAYTQVPRNSLVPCSLRSEG